MSHLINNQQKVNELIFAKRNKAYGAYAIRSAYGYTILRSLTFMLLGFGSIIIAGWYFNQSGPGPAKSLFPVESEQDTSVTIFDFTPVEDAAKHEAKQESKPAASSPDQSMSTNFSNQDTTREKTPADGLAVNTSTASGTGPETPDLSNGGPAAGNGTGTAVPERTITVKGPLLVADKAPEFEGGLRALYLFLSSKLKYPAVARAEGQEGTVHVRFVVDETGKIDNLTLMNNAGYGMDEEALRVAGMIPKFKTPGIKDGEPVKVYYHLPIRFRLRD